MSSSGESKVVSGRVDAVEAQAVERVLKSYGTSSSQVIDYVWHYIAVTGELPDCANAARSPEKTLAFKKLESLRRKVASGTDLENMTADDLKDELAGRG